MTINHIRISLAIEESVRHSTTPDINCEGDLTLFVQCAQTLKDGGSVYQLIDGGARLYVGYDSESRLFSLTLSR